MPNAVNQSIDIESRTELVGRAIDQLSAHYVFPEVAERVACKLRTQLAAGDYFSALDPSQLGEKITADILSVANDKHIRVRYHTTPSLQPDAHGDSEQAELDYRARCMECNFGVERVERLPLNIGYVELRGFLRADLAGETIVAAMTLVANTDALIFDLRRNGGGHPETVALVTSYLFDEPKHLNSFYLREVEKTNQFWTHAWVPGRRYGETKPVFVLVSPMTFSAAEEFAYNLKCLARATIIGEPTRGGAHPGKSRWLTPHYTIFVPDGRAINPITQTNWEGSGVEPDLRVPEADALRMAQLMALEQISSQIQDTLRQTEMAERIRVLREHA